MAALSKVMTLTPGDRMGPYKLLTPLGSGGMGEVYLAEDSRLHRRIALKVLSAEFTQDKERVRRFQQEARAASALNHPNIITIFEIGFIDTSHFIVTEFIDGETLRQRIAESALRLRDAVDVACQVADALAAAHASGIIHRDIKPENIMLRPDGYVKVLDFGLAKLTEKAERDTFSSDPEAVTRALVDTNPGIVMGTVSYMSPEQARGFKMDHRTDIYSLGAVLYEMVAGRKPFEGATISDVIAMILGREPAPLARFSVEAPDEIERIVAKALAKDREQRYQTAKDLAIDLRRLKQRLDVQAELERSGHSGFTAEPAGVKRGVPEPTTEMGVAAPGAAPALTTSSAEYLIGELKRHKRGAVMVIALLITVAAGVIYYPIGGNENPIDSLAVLPFVTAGENLQAEYLSDSFTERLISNLSRLPGLRVMSFSSVLRYKGQQPDPRSVGRELGVRGILTGRVVHKGDNLAISIELVDAADNTHLWGEQYNRKFADILLVQEDISKDASEKLRLRLTGDDRRRVEAHQLYLKGRSFWNKRTSDGLKKGVDYFQQAINNDPDFAPAYAGLADCYNMLVIYSALSPREGFPKAKAAAMRALELDETLAEAHTSLAFVRFRWDWDWADADREFKRAIELNANYAPAHQWYSNYLAAVGRLDEAIAAARRTQELDPLSLIIRSHLAWILWFAGRYDETIEECRKSLELEPNFFAARRYLGLAYEQKGMYDEAIEQFQRAMAMSGRTPMIKAHLGHAYAVAGRKGEARQVLADLSDGSATEYISPYLSALIHTGLGEKQEALDMLERSFEEHAEALVYLRADPRFARLRSEPRFVELLRRLGLKR